MSVIWKTIKGYKGKYKISSEGEVFMTTLKRNCLLFKATDGSSMVYLGGKSLRLHHLMADAFVPLEGRKRKGLDVKFLDGDKTNLHADNLAWTTRSETILNNNCGGKRGASFRKGSWVSTITIQGATSYLGSFKDIEDAYAAFYAAYKETYGRNPW